MLTTFLHDEMFICRPFKHRILVIGASGIPGRYIVASLRELQESHAGVDFQFVLLKGQCSPAPPPEVLSLFHLIVTMIDFGNVLELIDALMHTKPDIIISPLTPEYPAPVLDDTLIETLKQIRRAVRCEYRCMPLLINGSILDILHPSVWQIPRGDLESLRPHVELAQKQIKLSKLDQLNYCTIIRGTLLDHDLIKGFLGIHLESKTAVLYNGGNHNLTGCSLKFVGDAVAEVVRVYLLCDEDEQDQVINQRLRIAETEYSGRTLLQTVERITGESFSIVHCTTGRPGSAKRELRWNGLGAASFQEDGLHFGAGAGLSGKRRTLEDIVMKAIMDRDIHLGAVDDGFLI